MTGGFGLLGFVNLNKKYTVNRCYIRLARYQFFNCFRLNKNKVLRSMHVNMPKDTSS